MGVFKKIKIGDVHESNFFHCAGIKGLSLKIGSFPAHRRPLTSIPWADPRGFNNYAHKWALVTN